MSKFAIHPLSPRRYSLVVALVLLAILALVAVSVAEGADAKSEGASTRQLAGERGCTVCHRDAPSPRDADQALPLAPSWSEIAKRHRHRSGAEERLARTVMGGADNQRHWKDRIEFNRMDANPKLTRDEAHALVRWILSFPPAK